MKLLLSIALFVLTFSCKEVDKTPIQGQNDAEPAIGEFQDEEQPVLADFDTTNWVEVIRLDNSIILDIRYATANNFVNEVLYDCPRCFLRKEVAVALVNIQKELNKKGLGLKLYDCYRPRPIQWKLWNKVPNPDYVADPRKGSMHNRGLAVDLTLVDEQGHELDMGTDYDFFGREAHHSYTGLSKEVHQNRQILLSIMKKHGFRSTITEWWHYSLRDTQAPIDDWNWPCPAQE